MTITIDKLPRWEVGTFELGRHWPETGDYAKWYADQVADFEKNHILFSTETYSTNSGGTGLLAHGILKSKAQAYEEGKLCPECGRPNPVQFDPTPFGGPDDVAIHLLDSHGWDYEKARLWLRDKVEEKAFAQEA